VLLLLLPDNNGIRIRTHVLSEREGEDSVVMEIYGFVAHPTNTGPTELCTRRHDDTMSLYNVRISSKLKSSDSRSDSDSVCSLLCVVSDCTRSVFDFAVDTPQTDRRTDIFSIKRLP